MKYMLDQTTADSPLIHVKIDAQSSENATGVRELREWVKKPPSQLIEPGPHHAGYHHADRRTDRHTRRPAHRAVRHARGRQIVAARRAGRGGAVARNTFCTGDLADLSHGLDELRHRLYDESPRRTVEEVVPYPFASSRSATIGWTAEPKDC